MAGDRRGRVHRRARGAGASAQGHDARGAGRPVLRRAGFVPAGVPFVQGDILDTDARRRRCCDEHGCTGVIHVAGYKYAGVSVQRPLHTYDAERHRHGQRADGHGRRRRAASSSSPPRAAVYGTPPTSTWSPRTPRRTRVALRRVQADRRVADQRPGARRPPGSTGVSLRYFNVVGSGDRRGLRRQPAQPVPARLRGAARGRTPAHQRRRLPDAGRHLRARLRPRRRPGQLPRRRGPGAGRRRRPSRPPTTWAAATGLACGRSWTRWPRSPASTSRPRSARAAPGDPARIVADGTLPPRDLDWKMRHSVDEMVASAWSARRAHS